MKASHSTIASSQPKAAQNKQTPARGAKRPAQTAPWNEPEDDDPVPTDIHQFRYELARRISRYVANERKAWRSCRERACRRHHACAAPNYSCRNAPPPEPDPDGSRWARVSAKVQRALREVAAQRGEEGR